MDIVSIKFAVISIVSVFIFYFLPVKWRVGFLLLLSLGFVATYSHWGLLYVCLYALINYFLGLMIPRVSTRLLVYRLGLIINLAQLILLRYSTFAIDPVFRFFNSDIEVSRLAEFILPIGISYFTLQGIGYLINIKMGWEKPEKKFANFLLYIVFYPKFLSGPIERSTHFLPQLVNHNQFDEKQISDGLRTALFGFFKKIVIANQLAPFVHNTYSNLGVADGSALWLLLIIQPLYLYFDFSGYTDIAIGFARMFGINLLPNFNRPFFSENVTTFWKRFHMSLSLWFNDYVFRQTSFRRRKWGLFASTYAVFLTFTLFGIWHGAGWNFMLLGFLQAVAINYEFYTKKWRLRLFSFTPDLVRIWFGRIITYLFYGVSLIFFFSPDIHSSWNYLSGLFISESSFQTATMQSIPLSAMGFILIIFILEYINNDLKSLSDKLNLFWNGDKRRNILLRWLIYSIAISAIIINYTKSQQFIYTQF